jgi:hypothetical protein
MKGLSPTAIRNVQQFQMAPMGEAYFNGATQVLVGFADETGRILAMGPSLDTVEVQSRIGGGVVIPFRIELENLVGTSGTSFNLSYRNAGNELLSRNFYDNLGEAAMAFQKIRNSHLGPEGWLKKWLSGSALGTGRLSWFSQGVSLVSGIGLMASLSFGYGFIPMAVVWSLSSGYVFSAAHPARSLRQRLALWGVGIVLGGLSLIPIGLMHLGLLGALVGAVGVPASWGIAAVLGGVLDAFGHLIYNVMALRFAWSVASVQSDQPEDRVKKARALFDDPAQISFDEYSSSEESGAVRTIYVGVRQSGRLSGGFVLNVNSALRTVSIDSLFPNLPARRGLGQNLLALALTRDNRWAGYTFYLNGATYEAGKSVRRMASGWGFSEVPEEETSTEDGYYSAALKIPTLPQDELTRMNQLGASRVRSNSLSAQRMQEFLDAFQPALFAQTDIVRARPYLDQA